MNELAVIDTPVGATPTPPAGRIPPRNPFLRSDDDEQDAADGKGSVAKERMTLDEGPVLVSWPGELSKESVQDLDDWFGVLIRRMKRKAGIPEQPKQPKSDK